MQKSLHSNSNFQSFNLNFKLHQIILTIILKTDWAANIKIAVTIRIIIAITIIVRVFMAKIKNIDIKLLKKMEQNLAIN